MQLLPMTTTTWDDDIMSASGLVDRRTAAADEVALWSDAETLAAVAGAAQPPGAAVERLQVA